MANYSDVWGRIAREVPERTAIISVGGASMSYGSFDDQASRLATFLLQRGVQAGDKVAIDMYNRAEWLVTLFALLKIGAAPVPVSYRYRPVEVDHVLNDSDSVALIYPSTLAEVVRELQTPHDRQLLLMQVNDDPDIALLEGAVAFDHALAAEPWEVRDAPSGGELFIYTGGTTGRPKGVVWGIEEMLDIQTYPTYGALGLERPESVEGMVEIAKDEATRRPVTLPLSPFMHGTSLTSTINTLLLGGTMVVVPSSGFNADLAVDAVTGYGVTRIIVAGDAVAMRLLEAFEAHGITNIPSLTSIISSGMRFSDETKSRLHALGNLTITDILASSEGGPYALGISTSADDLPAKLRMTPGTVLFDADRNDVEIAPGAVGILAFGGSLPKGYYKDAVKSAETFPIIRGHRYVMPGDYARVLSDGSIELLGRGSSVVNSGGEKIYPSEVEEVLLTHPAVTDAVVFGTPHPSWGEVLSAAVAVRPGHTPTQTELQEFVGDALAGYKKPRIVLLRPSLERSPSGKVEITTLKADAEEALK
jgi:acyl-CoA synthetase (AMP-forming)/AMP-acid ligase II